MKMWMLTNLLFISVALSCVTDAAVIRVSGYEGTDVNVSCSYDQGYESYQKYLCRNDCGNRDVLITTSETKKNKYFIYDDEKTRTFTTTISDLQRSDAGTYWCGVTKTLTDIYTEVRVSVVPDSCCDSVTKIQSYDGGSVSISCPYESEYQNNLKYMCRGNQPSTCLQQAVVSSDSNQTTQFTLTDDRKSKFTVNITNLSQKHSGSYLCGVHRNTGLDLFSAVKLEVKVFIYVYILPLILSLLFIFTFVFVMVYKNRINKMKGSGVSVDISNTDDVERGERSPIAVCEHPGGGAHSEAAACEQQSARRRDGAAENIYQSLSATENIYSVCHSHKEN